MHSNFLLKYKRKTLRISNKGFENSVGCGKRFGCQDDAKMLDFTP